MPETIADWLPFDASQPKRRRAENVCFVCHSKKIKCDLQARSAQGQRDCTNCNASGRDCELRPSKRAKRSSLGLTSRSQRPLTPRTESADDLAQATTFDQETGLDDVHVFLLDFNDPAKSREVRQDDATSIAAQNRPPLTQRLPAPQLPQASVPYDPSPAQLSQRSSGSRTDFVGESQKGDIDTGFLQVYGPENSTDAEKQAQANSFQQRYPDPDPQQQVLKESFAETYFEYLYPWCPVLDPDFIFEEISRSPLLENALATAGSNVQPPLIPHPGPAEYYMKARSAFYNDEESDPLLTLKAVALFYWWAPRAPTTVHRHSSWWWTSVLIRHAQQMNLHRQPVLNHPMRSEYILSVRRRIWWTAFARERLTALCQSKPAIIDTDDCNVAEPSLADFPDNPKFQRKGEIFIWWVRLCAIIGRVAKTLYRPGHDTHSGPTTSDHIQELSGWINSLPAHLQLPIRNARTQNFDRDIHQLHLPFLTTVIILHLKRCEQPLPRALPPAILAASCIARILRDILARGNSRFLMAITCWYSGTAFIPLLQASHMVHLSRNANECLDLLERTAEQLQKMWASANVIREGFQRLRNTSKDTVAKTTIFDQPGEAQSADLEFPGHQDVPDLLHASLDVDSAGEIQAGDQGFDWTTLFPFVTRQTSSIADSLLTGREQGIITRAFPSPDNGLFHETLMAQFDELFAIDGCDFTPTLA